MQHDGGRDHDLLSVIDELLRPPTLTLITIEQLLGVKLVERRLGSNRYYRFFEATARLGPTAGDQVTVSYREPVQGHTGPRLLTVDLGETATVTIDKMIARYGEAVISQILPDAGPDGSVSYSFSIAAPIQLTVSRSYSASTVCSVTLKSG